ncbi:Ubiquitin-like modifier-activating enzyme 1 [Tritrichomonas foetus]|uniref:E1 ubiquitin-activating enzyme n=1 Tax=Tritrichomonas foetus TaxID=1144522 RepID=A0A1J4JQX0_9EUKA|nr:Ubiquitin-like modifier-activating enzyme 1 [Tritrichomonas foetus]|eukprot:OHT01138.1 Ubiquitin-like modifier-activating enzyme 1 [Tritrichomonas foetus]
MSSEPVIDENLYSRQIYVLGVDAMKKLAASSVLISGMGGLGVEIAKNVILAGINNVTIHDCRNVQMSDLASNFYLSESVIGQNRALACLEKLSSLNEYVTVSAKNDELTNDFIQNYNCVVITDYHRESEINRISTFCHENNIKLILTETHGVFAYIFNDFGQSFFVNDPNGEPPARFLISFITNSENGTVTIAEDEAHDLGDDSRVRFEEVEGMTEVNGKEFDIKLIDRRHFTIGDTSNFGKYTSVHRSGYGNQVIVPKEMKFNKLTEALKQNGETISTPFDFCAFGRDQQVVLAFIASHRVLEKHESESTETYSNISAEELISAASELNEEFHIVESIDEDLFREFARERDAVISPTCAAFGGIAGQEVIKAISNKFTPIYQFLAMAYVESLPADKEYELQNDRYDPYRIVFGNKQHEKMTQLKYFMIGAGALGCEQLKNWALMGIASGENGKVYITDMDTIERSNLNRQFLFRNSDIGKMKSDAAAAAAKVMNPAFTVEAQQNRIGPESAHIYHDRFYTSLDGVCNALDNVQTRLFSDQMCVYYRKPLLESGTLGPKAHYQIVAPDLTESYGSQQDAPEKGIPMCTLHNFPSCIDHCCMWARDQFGGLFEQQPQSVNTLIKDPKSIESSRKSELITLQQSLEAAKSFFVTEKCTTFDDCIRWARLKFEEYFNHKIRDLQHEFPKDKMTDEGLMFWSGNKRFPSPVEYDATNQYHADFINAAATLRARICGVPVESNAAERASKVEVPEWKPSGTKIKLDDDQNNESNQDDNEEDDQSIDSLIAEVRPLLLEHKLLNPEQFEKDEDSNGHMDFVAAAANIRAINYDIEPKDKLEIKRIAGKIIPAIATTTAMICGLVALEMYKVHSIEKKKVEDFRFGSINLAVSLFNIVEPAPCHTQKCEANGLSYTLWDTWTIKGDLTVKEFIEAVKETYKVQVDMLNIGKSLVYASFMPKYNTDEYFNKKLTAILVQDMNQPPLADGQFLIRCDANCVDINNPDVDVEIPPIALDIRGESA